MILRSTEESTSLPSLGKAGTSLADALPEASLVKTSESSLEKNLSTDSRLSELEPHLEELEGVTPVAWSVSAWVAQDQVSETRVAKAQAWETLALEAQVRPSLQPKPSNVEETAVTTSEVISYMSKKESKVSTPCPRLLWSSKLKYILALNTYLLMPYRLWRFVSQWLHKGGCTFLIVYTLMLFCIGIPLLFLELAVGQRAQHGSMDLWKSLSPWFGGVGYSMFMVCFIVNTYMNLYNSWFLFYMCHMFYFTVPWEYCPLQRNSSDFDPECEQGTSYMYFWYRQTLKVSDKIELGGPLNFSLVVFLFMAWCLTCVCMINGIKSLEKMEGTEYGLKHLLVLKMASIYDPTVWSQAGIQVVFDMGLGFGPIIYFSSYMPDFNNCLGDAFLMALIKMLTLLFTVPIILSILGFWATISTHRCCKKNTEVLRMLIFHGILPSELYPPDLLNNPTSTYNSWLNSLLPPLRSTVLSMVPECNIQEQFLKIEESPRFVFLTFLEVISLFPESTLWTVLFFVMLLCLGLCAVVTFMLGIIIPLQDTFPFFRRWPKILTVGASMVMFLCSLFFTKPSGIYYFWLLSEYWVALPILSIVMCENLAVAWAYRAKRFLSDMMVLLSRPICPVCGWLWYYVSPVLLLGLLVALFFKLGTKPLTYIAWNSSTSKEMVHRYPAWALVLILGLYAFTLIPIPAYFAYCLILGVPVRTEGSPKLRCRSGQAPTEKNASKNILQGYKTKSLSS
ncbi:orphan sodium-and chloride-dependent neurotransmitter transporter NTT5 [Sigmodon hispidus]